MLRISLATMTCAFALSACAVSLDPIKDEDHIKRAELQLAEVISDKEPLTGPVTLYEAMARAVKYNLDHQVEVQRSIHALRQKDVASSARLPQLLANSAFSGRDSESYSVSQALGGARGAVPSFSADKSNLTGDLTFSWNILDFGISYVRAKQEADRALIAIEDRRRVLNNVTEQVRVAFWRAVSAERLLKGFDRLDRRVEKALSNSKNLGEEGITSPEAQLLYQRDLIDVQRQIDAIRGELNTAKIELAALMDIEPGSHYHLKLPKRNLRSLSFDLSADDMRREALLNRPELRSLAYTSRINQEEAKVALLEILPGINFNAGANGDRNSFLYEASFVSWGAAATWNMMKVFSYDKRKKLVEQEGEFIKKQELALAMSILTQVEISRVNYRQALDAAKTVKRYLDVQNKIVSNLRKTAQADALSEQALIREEMTALVASVEYDVAFATFQSAFARKYATMGRDPYGENFDFEASIPEMSAALQQTWSTRGDIGH